MKIWSKLLLFHDLVQRRLFYPSNLNLVLGFFRIIVQKLLT